LDKAEVRVIISHRGPDSLAASAIALGHHLDLQGEVSIFKTHQLYEMIQITKLTEDQCRFHGVTSISAIAHWFAKTIVFAFISH
jgi:hypothetical protein